MAGNSILQEQIKAGKTIQEIKETWQEGINDFKAYRKNYLLYEDFE